MHNLVDITIDRTLNLDITMQTCEHFERRLEKADCLRTIGDGSGKLNLVQPSRSTQTVTGNLRSLRVYVNTISDCLRRNYIPQCSEINKQGGGRSKHTEQR
jgi:hypothetical protein